MQHIHTYMSVSVCFNNISLCPPSPRERECEQRNSFWVQKLSSIRYQNNPFVLLGIFHARSLAGSIHSLQKGFLRDLYFIFTFLQFINFCGVSLVVIKYKKNNIIIISFNDDYVENIYSTRVTPRLPGSQKF